MRKHRFRPGAFFLLIQAGLLTGCVNHIENGEYISTGEIMAGAFANLVIGMGTVFAVLIFLTWVISLFKHVGKLESRIAMKKAPKAQPEHKRRKRPKEAVQKEAAPASEASDETGADPVHASGARIKSITPAPSDMELQAVIAAAIAAYESDVHPAEKTAGTSSARPKQAPLLNGIHVRSYKRS